MVQLKAKPRKTVDDYMKLPEGTRAELIEGEILMSPSPRRRHQDAAINLSGILRDFVRSKRLGKVYAAPFDVHLPSGDVVQPDVIYVSNANRSILQDWIRGTPDLLIEILSPDSIERDRMVKRDLYARNGVKEYWIVDPESQTVEVLALAQATYAPAGYFERNDAVTSPLLSGLELPLRQIFE
ncbi:MAG: Uma2 family endonuclease [Planctomycetes bacterium]|nr:Uma2 family endonuclease [Planctomycetota bacterium]